MSRMTARRRIARLRLPASPPGVDGASGGTTVAMARVEDTVAVEEPLEIRLAGRPLSITMRTPGHDFDLIAGFLVSEGVIRAADDLVSMVHCASDTVDGEHAANTYNVVDVRLAPSVPPPAVSLARNVYMTSSCGVCGKASIDAVRTESAFDVAADALRVSPAVLARLPDTMREAQRLFDRTGGLHAAGLFDAEGQLLCLREDVGRHNALDKVVGWALRAGRLPLRGCVVQVSGRASFELAQKAVMAGVPVLAAVSAPSSLAVELAEEAGLTLVGFSRGTSLNVYAHAERLS